LGQVAGEYGIVRYPGCIMADIGHEIVFTGTLTFEAGELVVDGEFLNYSFPGGSDGLYPAPILTGRPSAAV